VVFITGDSTVKNEDKNKDGMWGWGSQAYTVFNNKKITCVNAAKAGRSTRTYLNEGRWDPRLQQFATRRFRTHPVRTQ
jgi:lysophospholipase L1-like esterase